MIVVVGLPGSGKTTACSPLIRAGHMIFDDFISSFYTGRLMRALREGRAVCATDPRLCIPAIFDEYMSRFREVVEDIEVICFENDPDACIENISTRPLRARGDTLESLIRTIRGYSAVYDLDRYPRATLLPVHSPDSHCSSRWTSSSGSTRSWRHLS